MDPDGYVKKKCVATGSRSQSQVIRGLVFKKHAAHKHMPTKYKNRRLLLIQGALGLSSSGMSSFDTMQQILLKGTHSEELKRIKCVVQCAVVMAYHLILETSFRLDQSAMFSTIPFSGVPSLLPTDRQLPSVQPSNSKIFCLVEPAAETDSPGTIDIPLFNGYHEEGSHDLNLALEGNSTFFYKPYNPVILSGLSSLSASLKKVIGDCFPLFSPASRQSMSTYFGFNERDPNSHSPAALCVLTSPEAFDQDVEVKGSSDEDKASDRDQSNPPAACFEASSDTHKSVENSEDQIPNKDEISTVLDSEEYFGFDV